MSENLKRSWTAVHFQRNKMDKHECRKCKYDSYPFNVKPCNCCIVMATDNFEEITDNFEDIQEE